MTRRPRHLPLACLALALCARAPLLADTIVLRNGQKLQGRVTVEGEKARVELDVGATLLIDRGDIAETIVEGAASAAAGEAVAVSPELMARLERREKIHLLIEALADEKEAARLKAETELSQAGRSALPIVRTAFAEGTGTQRLHLLRVLASIGDPASVPKIVAILRDPNDTGLQAEAAKALADIAGPEAALVLTEVLVNSKDNAVRLACLDVLGRLRPAFAAPFVVGALDDAALRAGGHAAVSRWLDPVFLPYVLPALDEGSREARAYAAGWVSALITPAHVGTLTKLLELYKDSKAVSKALVGAASRLHRDFADVGDVELLAATQDRIRDAAYDALRRAHRDGKKRGPTPREWQPERDAATRPRLVLTAIGSTNRATLREMATDLETSMKSPGATFEVTVEIGRKPLPLPAAGEGPRDARELFERLEQLDDFQTVRDIGVTNVEVTMPGCERALAPTRRGGPVVVSLARLGKGRDDVLRRGRRLLLHALARSLDLGPCTDPACPSSTVYEVEDLDAKSPRYCARCVRAFGEMWAAESEIAGFYYDRAARRLAAIAAQRKSKELCAAAACLFERGLLPLEAIQQWEAYQGLETDPAATALVKKRIELLDRAEKWLTKRKVAPAPAPRRGRR